MYMNSCGKGVMIILKGSASNVVFLGEIETNNSFIFN